jgi:YD repeat-containing protein
LTDLRCWPLKDTNSYNVLDTVNTASHAALVVRHLGQLKQADYRRDAAVVRVQQAESDDGARSAKLTHDANGNLTRDETGRQFVYDAWNRLVAVKDAEGNLLKGYAYDGLHRRIQETAGGVTTDLYYSDAWQVLEERVGGQVKAQYVWSPVYVDALILRNRDSNGDGTLDERLYVVQEANYNVTALFDNSGNVVERYIYDPFGSVTVLDAD